MFSIKSVIRYLALLGCAGLLLFFIPGCGGGGSSDSSDSGGGNGSTCSVCSIAIQSNGLTINVGNTDQLSAEAYDVNGATVSGVTFTWDSSDKSVATVDSTGLVTAVTDGTAKITASASGVTSDAVTVSVTGIPTTAVSNAVAYSSANLDSPDALAIDSAGNIWVANYNGTGLTEISPTAATDCSSGCSIFDSKTTGGTIVSTNFTDIAVDQSDVVWTLSNTTLYRIANGKATSYTINKYYFGPPQYLTIDNSGNIWMNSNSNSPAPTITTVTNAGTEISPSGGYLLSNSYNFNTVNRLAVDNSGNVWTSAYIDNKQGNVVELPAASPASPVAYSGGGLYGALAVAVDNSGNVWAINAGPNGGGSSSITEIKAGAAPDCSTGCVNYTNSALNGAAAEMGLAIDGDDNVWVTGGNQGDIVRIAPDAAADCSTGCTAYTSTALQHPDDIAIDASGNVWVTDEDANKVVKFPALAAATVTPIVAQHR